MSRLVVYLSLAVMALSATVFIAWQRSSPEIPTQSATSAPDIGGAYTLVDHNGATVTDRNYRGKYMLVFFGYTYCPDVCPTVLQKVTQAMTILGPRGDKVQPIFISVDPERDTPEALKDYVGNFHPRLIALTGSPEQVAAAAKAYKVYFAKVTEEGAARGEYLMNHSSIIFLIGPDGKYASHFSHATPPKEIAAGIEKLL